MNLLTYHRRSVAYHRRSHLAVALGVAVGTAALTGALLVGDSMRGSLRQAALSRLGRVTHALIAPRFFSQQVAARFNAGRSDESNLIVPAIIVQGSVTHTDTQARANRVQVLGVNDRFWPLSQQSDAAAPTLQGRSVVLNRRLADELDAQVGAAVLLRIGQAGDVATETLLGRRDQATVTLRLTVAAVIPSDRLGGFSLSPQQQQPANAFVPLSTLQRALGVPGRVNALLASGPGSIADFNDQLARAVEPPDLGLRLHRDDQHGYLALESEAFLLEPPVESAGLAAARAVGASTFPILTYLANSIDVVRPEASKGIPYSTVSAVEPAVLTGAITETGQPPALGPGQIVLNRWAADDLNAHPGDRIRLTYYLTDSMGELRTEAHEFEMTGVVALEGPAEDPGFTPTYPGITDTESLSDWDPPFPVDLKKVRDKDDAYWKRYRATPKAFVALQDGVRLWANPPERFGRLTSLRLTPPAGTNLASLERSYGAQLQQALPLAALGLQWDAVRARALAAGKGSTDFGGLFIGFSFFLILSAAMLVALLFRLAAERRAGEVGLLLASGFAPAKVSRLLVWEGGTVAAIGAAAGLAAALGYAWLMLAGLRSFWSAAVNAPFLHLHVGAVSLVIGYVSSVALAAGSVAWSLRGLTRMAPRALLAGTVSSGGTLGRTEPTRASIIVAGAAFVTAGALVAASLAGDFVPQTVAFFGGGAAAMVGCLAIFRRLLMRPPRSAIGQAGIGAWVRLGFRNAPRNRGRSMLTVGLIASASFVIVALQAFRLDAGDDIADKHSGSGGFALMAESAAPLFYDLNSPAGRESLDVDPTAEATLAGMNVLPFRLRPGDETSCLNLYTPDRPRIIGAPQAMIDRGGFSFAGTLDETPTERDNPWTLLNRRFDDGA
ncbi:MAG: ABC transporter permease, partial [Phycisphaerae bacterium]